MLVIYFEVLYYMTIPEDEDQLYQMEVNTVAETLGEAGKEPLLLISCAV